MSVAQPRRGHARRQPRPARPPPGRRTTATLTFDQLEQQIDGLRARARACSARFFQTNAEGEFVEHLHRLEGLADGIILNPGAWTHYAWAIRDALEIAALPAVEVHLSDVDSARGVAPASRSSATSASRPSAARASTATATALERLKEELDG